LGAVRALCANSLANLNSIPLYLAAQPVSALRTGDAQGTELLARAVAAYRSALEVFTRKQLPQQWAATQNNLGSVLQEQGIRTEGVQGTELLSAPQYKT
jgi:hypothetical protein